MADIVKTGRRWEINSRNDYDIAMQILDENEFCADMSDDFMVWQIEKEEVQRQRHEVRRQALAKGLIEEHEDENRHWH